ncbi:MAG TPA: Gfo/Idh/MocA family oxidoreductase [Caldilineae bacterium]|nr:Gfo/Idh/MocA family oxidoreductase [Caldilineae bacterium]
MSQPVEAVLVGAGNRGREAYGAYALRYPHRLKFVAVAEPIEERRELFARQHNIPPERRFASWEDLYAQGQLAPALVNCTMDRDHVASTLPALELGYHVLLEKPMAVTPHDCVRLVRAAEKADRILQICHVLRYTPFFAALYEVVHSGRLGDVMTVEHKENVAYWHMAHSFVRGNWRNSRTSSPMILAKSCHDLDILAWMIGTRCLRISSFGSLTLFRPDRVGPEIPERCTDGCPIEDECPFYAPRIYLTEYTGWPVSVISLDTSLEARLKALQEGPYGRCVYRCDNDVVDHQVVAMEFENDVTVVFTMHGHSHKEGRTMRYDGSRATLRGSAAENELVIYDHVTGREEVIHPGQIGGGHGGGDTGLMNAFVKAVRNPGQEVLSSARASLQSHLMAFAAEEARLTGQVVDMVAYAERIEAEVMAEEG